MKLCRMCLFLLLPCVLKAGVIAASPEVRIVRHQQAGKPCGIDVKIRNSGNTQTYKIEAYIYDIFGLPLKKESQEISVDKNTVGNCFFGIPEKEKASLVRFRIVSQDGKILYTASAFVTREPASLEPIDGSKHFGLSMFPYLPPAEEKRMLALLGACGCKNVRGFEMDRSYDNKHHTIVKGVMDRIIKRLRSVGVEHILSILAYCPTWASTIPMDRPAQERRYVMPRLDVWTRLVKDYTVDKNFDAFEVWNEPNGGGWNSYPKSVTYAKLLRATYTAIKEVRPDAVVVLGGANNGGISWPESVLKLAHGYADVVAFHSYRYGNRINAPEKGDPGFPSCISVVKRLTEMTQKYNDGKPMPLWNTEFGYRYPEETNPSFDANDQAKFLVRSFLVLAACGVEKSYSFQLRDSKGDSPHKFGLCRSDWSIKPSWLAFRTLNRHTAGRTIGSLISISPNIDAVEMRSGSDTVTAVWSIDNPSVVMLDGNVLSLEDLYGRKIAAKKYGKFNVCVIPAGSLVYATSKDSEPIRILPLIDIVPCRKCWPVSATPEYKVKIYPRGKQIFGEISQSLRPACFTDEPVDAAYPCRHGKITLKGKGFTVDVPIIYPVAESLTACVEYNNNGKPMIVINNLDSREKVVELTYSYLNVKKNYRLSIRGNSKIQIPIDVSLDAFPNGVLLTGEIICNNVKLPLRKELWAAKAVEASSTSEETKWQTLQKWHKNTAARPQKQDLSVRVCWEYTKDYLYLIADVQDDIHFQKEAGGCAWMGDSLQLAFAKKGASFGTEMLFYLTSDGRKGMYCFDPEVVIENVKFDIKRDKGHTFYRIGIPMNILGIDPRKTKTIPFSFIVNENDTGSRKGYFRWADGIGNGKDITKYGVVILR